MLKFKHTSQLFVLPKGFVTGPANSIAVWILMAARLPITPNRSLGLTSVLFCDEDIGALVGEDVFPSAPDTSMLIIRPYELPFSVLSPRAVWPFWYFIGAPWWATGRRIARICSRTAAPAILHALWDNFWNTQSAMMADVVLLNILQLWFTQTLHFPFFPS